MTAARGRGRADGLPPATTTEPGGFGGAAGRRSETGGRAGGRSAAAITLRIVLLLLLTAALALASLYIGTRGLAPSDVWPALLGHGEQAEVIVLRELRLPRTVAALVAGVALGVAGALGQAITRNPLADPGLLGVNAGAAFAVSIAIGLLGITAIQGYLWFALGGALVAMVAVYVIGTAGRGVDPVRITLGGVAIAAVLTGLTAAMTQADPESFDRMRVWNVGSLSDRGWSVLLPVVPWIAVGLVIAVLAARPLNAIALGDDLAASLGVNIRLTKTAVVVALTLLAGATTALAGPIVFVGLVVPHAARWLGGQDQRIVIGLSALLGPILVVAADLTGRVVLSPAELPVGIVTAFIGGPVLIALVRRRKFIR